MDQSTNKNDPLRFIPNLISILRIALIAPTLWFIITYEYRWALLLFLIAGISDGLDGFLARRMCWESKLGEILDPIADKLLLVLSYLALWLIGLVPWWLLAVIAARDLFLIGGGLYYYFTIGPFAARPTSLSKINTFLQIALVLLVVADAAYGLFSAKWMEHFMLVVLVSTALSGMDYAWNRGRLVVTGRRLQE